MTRPFVAAGAALALSAVYAPPIAAAPADLALVEQHLARTQTMTARFVQADARGRQMAGTLQLKRPGRVRFDYGSNARMLLVGDGSTLSFVDYGVGQKSTWPIAKSPLAVLLSPNPDIGRIARIIPQIDDRVIVVRARDTRRPEFGTLLLAFTRAPGSPAGLRLEGWTAIDAQNKRTTVKLADQRYNVAVPESAFQFEEPKKGAR